MADGYEESLVSMSTTQKYLFENKVLNHLENAVVELSKTLPDDPMLFLGNFFMHTSPSRSTSGCQTDTRNLSGSFRIESVTHLSYEESKVELPVVETLFGNRIPISEVDQEFAPYLTQLASDVRKGTS